MIHGRGARNKGANGEREFAQFATAHGFTSARRHAAQGHGGSDEDPDVRGIDGVHVEVKRVEKSASGDLYSWYAQASNDIGDSGRIPLVAHRRNRLPWMAVLKMEDFLRIYKVYLSTQEW